MVILVQARGRTGRRWPARSLRYVERALTLHLRQAGGRRTGGVRQENAKTAPCTWCAQSSCETNKTPGTGTGPVEVGRVLTRLRSDPNGHSSNNKVRTRACGGELELTGASTHKQALKSCRAPDGFARTRRGNEGRRSVHPWLPCAGRPRVRMRMRARMCACACARECASRSRSHQHVLLAPEPALQLREACALALQLRPVVL